MLLKPVPLWFYISFPLHSPLPATQSFSITYDLQHIYEFSLFSVTPSLKLYLILGNKGQPLNIDGWLIYYFFSTYIYPGFPITSSGSAVPAITLGISFVSSSTVFCTICSASSTLIPYLDLSHRPHLLTRSPTPAVSILLRRSAACSAVLQTVPCLYTAIRIPLLGHRPHQLVSRRQLLSLSCGDVA